MSYKEIWETLSKLDCSEYVEKKQNLSYISWANALAILMDHYPEATWEYSPDLWLDNRTVEVGCTITIGECKRHMTLPVMDYKMKAVADPSSRDISDARMRCWVKCVALFGLGLYLYRGQDLPQAAPEPQALPQKMPEKPLEQWVDELSESIASIKEGIESGDLAHAAQCWFELTDEEKKGIWVSSTMIVDGKRVDRPGAPFTTQERDVMKSREFKVAYHGENAA